MRERHAPVLCLPPSGALTNQFRIETREQGTTRRLSCREQRDRIIADSSVWIRLESASRALEIWTCRLWQALS